MGYVVTPHAPQADWRSAVDGVPGGDHEIVVGRVRHVETSASPAGPLVYFRGGYASLAS